MGNPWTHNPHVGVLGKGISKKGNVGKGRDLLLCFPKRIVVGSPSLKKALNMIVHLKNKLKHDWHPLEKKYL